jgi:hypothetical protein
MQRCLTCGNDFTGRQCPRCGGKPLPSAWQINKELKNYPLPAVTGLFGVPAANHFYSLFDSNPLFGLALCVFFFPMLFHVVTAVRKRLALDVNHLKIAYRYCGGAVVLLALVVAGNGALDRSTVRVVKSSILRKGITSGRYSTTHHFYVTSWRAGRSTEDLWVGGPIYADASVGEFISIEVHEGFFGLPWYGKIFLDSN